MPDVGRCLRWVWISALLGALAAHAAPTVFVHVRGHTFAGDRLVTFDALAIDDARVLATGTARDLLARYPGARRIDGGGRALLPGLIDAHGHVLDLGFQATQLDLTATDSLPRALAQVRRYAAAHPGSGWIIGSGWNQERWRLGRFPTARELDAVVPDRPAALERVDKHALWVNGAALRAARITRETPDPVGGRIERDADGTPTGVLVDAARQLVRSVQPQPSHAERAAALTAALERLASVGLTSVGDARVTAADVALYREFADRGRLTTRIYAMIRDTGEDFRTLSAAGPLIGYGGDHLTVRAVKLFADGSLGSRGAALLAPYADAPGQRGLEFLSDAELRAKIETALRAGYQVNVHAIGDAANRQVLDAFTAAYRVVDGRALRNRIEHAQILAPEDIPRFVPLGLIASMQPTHATSDRLMAERRLGPARLRGAYAWRTFLAQGTPLAGGSDFPVESPNPFYGLYAAVTRMDRDGLPPGGWHPEQAMTLEEAFRAFTLTAAYAQHQEGSLGSLEAGKWADFVLLDRDPFAIPARDLWKVRVLQTWVGGAPIYRATGG